jgi:hypothetical protein
MLNESFGLRIMLRGIIVSIGCCAAAVFLTFGKPARAGELQSSNGVISRGDERCAAHQPGIAVAGDTSVCKRIGDRVRVGLGSRMPYPSGYGLPAASHVAVRLDESAPSRSHLRLPAGETGLDPFPR